MPDNVTTIGALITGYIRNELNGQQQQALQQWVDTSESNRQLFHELTSVKHLAQNMELWDAGDKRIEAVWQKIVIPVAVPSIPSPKKISWLKYTVAAATIVLTVSAGIWFWQRNPAPAVVQADDTENRFKNDVAPANQSAILKLADGSEIILDSAANGSLAQQQGMKIIKKGDEVIYEFEKPAANTAVVYNTMLTAKGKQYQLVLADGTRVWLNAESSITFPSAFTGNERRVKITGELYFDVVSLPLAPSGGGGKGKMPFIVEHGDMSIEVTGTQFNVNAYTDEGMVRTTLVEGSVTLRQARGNSEKRVVLKPGQQGLIAEKALNRFQVNDNADLAMITAWKNGLFKFDHTDLKSIMRQLARWYNVEVVYEGNIDEKNTITGEVPLTTSLSTLIQVLQLSDVNCHLEVDNLLEGIAGRLVVKPLAKK